MEGSDQASTPARGRAQDIPNSPPPRYPSTSSGPSIPLGSPAPSFWTEPRFNEQTLGANRRGVPLGTEEDGQSIGSNVDSLAVRYPISELERRGTPTSITSSFTAPPAYLAQEGAATRSTGQPSVPDVSGPEREA